MTSRQMHPITLSALRHLRMHGTSTIAQLKTTLPELESKTVQNLAQLGYALRTEAGYQITGKGKARLQKEDQPSAAAPAPAAEIDLSGVTVAQTDQRILDTLRRAISPITLQEIGVRTGLPLSILRPSLTTLVQAGTVVGSTGKPSRYRLREAMKQAGAAAAARRRVQTVNGALVGGNYHGQELLRNPGIGPERFTAFELPSRVGNRLHWPDGRVTPFSEHPGLPA
jgi:hypothetical protein